MQYSKPPLTYAQQAQLLIGRGLLANAATLENRLQSVNYYRLSGYLYPFRNPDDTFKPGTTLDQVWRRYTFDRRFRLLIMDPIERVEIAIRTQLVYEHAHKHGAFGYENLATLPGLQPHEHSRFLDQMDQEMNRSPEVFVQHFKAKYGSNHQRMPIWSAAEILSLGATLTLYRAVEFHIQSAVAKRYGVAPTVLLSWLRAFHAVRNICAHHGRLWNRVLGVRPMIPRAQKHPDWHTPVSFTDERVFAMLTALKYMMNDIAPQSRWPDRLRELLNEYPDIPIANMGFPPNWDLCPIWNKTPCVLRRIP